MLQSRSITLHQLPERTQRIFKFMSGFLQAGAGLFHWVYHDVALVFADSFFGGVIKIPEQFGQNPPKKTESSFP